MDDFNPVYVLSDAELEASESGSTGGEEPLSTKAQLAHDLYDLNVSLCDSKAIVYHALHYQFNRPFEKYGHKLLLDIYLELYQQPPNLLPIAVDAWHTLNLEGLSHVPNEDCLYLQKPYTVPPLPTFPPTPPSGGIPRQDLANAVNFLGQYLCIAKKIADRAQTYAEIAPVQSDIALVSSTLAQMVQDNYAAFVTLMLQSLSPLPVSSC